MYLLKVPESWWQGDNGSVDRNIGVRRFIFGPLEIAEKISIIDQD